MLALYRDWFAFYWSNGSACLCTLYCIDTWMVFLCQSLSFSFDRVYLIIVAFAIPIQWKICNAKCKAFEEAMNILVDRFRRLLQYYLDGKQLSFVRIWNMCYNHISGRRINECWLEKKERIRIDSLDETEKYILNRNSRCVHSVQRLHGVHGIWSVWCQR